MTISAMIVDDQDDVRLLIRMTIDLANDGLAVSGEARSGEEALSQVADLDPSVIVLDEMMPGMHGVDVAGRILADRPEQVIVLCSAHLDDALRDRALHVGVRAALEKTRIDELPALLRTLADTG